MIAERDPISTINSADEKAISAIPFEMVDAWNRGDGEAFASRFTDDADFIAFEGSHLKGRRDIAAFHQQLFDGPVKGTRLEGEVKFVRFLNSKLALMHGVVKVTLPGETKPSPGRDSMQLFVVAKHRRKWFVEAVQNCRNLSVERQYLLDDFDSLTPEAQMEVINFAASLKQEAPISR
jgi:uncharacterized protein (TIGR02246 family)